MKLPRKKVTIFSLIAIFVGLLIYSLVNFPQILYTKDETYVHNPRGLCQGLKSTNNYVDCDNNYCNGKVIDGECWVPRFNFLKSGSENNY